MHNDIFLLKTSEGGGKEKKKDLVDIFLSFWSPQIKEIKINLANKEALNKTIYGVGILLSFWKNSMTLLHCSVQLKNKKSIITFLWIL